MSSALRLLEEARALLLEGEARRAVELAAEAAAVALLLLEGYECSGGLLSAAESLARLVLGRREPSLWEAEEVIDEARAIIVLAAGRGGRRA